MNSKLTIIPGTQIALFCSSGQVEFEDRMRNIEYLSEFCEEKSIKHLIVDIRQQESQATTLQMVNLGALVPEILKSIQIAIVCQSSDRDALFGETVAANRGASSRSFATVEEAQKWLEAKNITPNQPLQGTP